jgi:phosphoglycolate phosphatase
MFDLDGTLVDPRVGIVASLRAAFEAVAISHESWPDEQLARQIGVPLPTLLAGYGVPAERSAVAIEGFQRHFASAGPVGSTPHPGIPALVDELCRREVVLAVATSKPIAAAEAVLEHHGWRDRFAVVAGARPDESGAAKVEVIAAALEALRGKGLLDQAQSPNREIVVGDRAEDVAGARTNGIEAVAVTWGFGTRTELANTRPRWWAESVAELHQVLLTELCVRPRSDS